MVWKIRDSCYAASSAEFAVEIIEISTCDDIKIQSSASCFEVVYDVDQVYFDFDEERRVRFSADNEYFTIINREEITPVERQALWFRKAELKRMRERDENRDGDDMCQEINEDGAPHNEAQDDELQEALHQLMAVSIVLDEQVRQRSEQICDPELIAEKYRKFVQRSRQSIFISSLAREWEKKHTQNLRSLQFVTTAPIFTETSKLQSL